MVAFDTTKHDAGSDHVQLVHCIRADLRVFGLRKWVEQFLVEDRDMFHSGMLAIAAAVVIIELPMQDRTGAALAEVVGERAHFKEAEQREELSNAVLHGSTRQAPLVSAIEGEASFCDSGCA